MSRIEKALEKAAQMAQMRRPVREYASLNTRDACCSQHVFQVVETIIDAAQVNEHLVTVTAPQSLASEQYKKLRARIEKNMQKDGANSILVASANTGEGKTTTAINLAVTMARAIDYTVLLVDADLRQPSVHTYLGLKPKSGLSEYLQSKVQLSDVLIKTGIGKLVVLPAGSPPENPAELLASEKMKELVKELKCRYDDRYVIFDSSPLLTAADAITLCASVDGVILVVQALQTAPKNATHALSLIKGTHVLGTVFNSVPSFLATSNAPYYNRYFAASAGKQRAEEPENAGGWFRKIFRQLI